MPLAFKVCPWDLLIFIAKHTLTENCSLLNANGKSVGIIGILGINTNSPVAGPVKTVASMTLLH